MSVVPRFFVSPASLREETVALPEDAGHHARTVLRLRTGDPVILHDGEGRAYPSAIAELGRRVVLVRRGEPEPVLSEPATAITVFQALPRTGEKLEQVLQHGTEIGAAGFVLFPSAWSGARFETRERRDKKVERWQTIVRSAAEQCGRGVLPAVRYVDDTDAAISGLSAFGAVLLLDQRESRPLRAALEPLPRGLALAVLVGPESGFDAEEADSLRGAGAIGVCLGPRVLRTETAALAALAQILYDRDG
jgi:16S rRNA (uracil1498-N3)-methyltransferase